jgi:signal transduction histidine kinase
MGLHGWLARSRVHWNLRTLSLAALALLIGVVAALQYRWISQLSVAQRFRAQARASEEVRIISDALDTEITRAILAFTMPLSPASSMPASSMYDMLQQSWAAWNQEAPWPQIVSGICLFEERDGAWHRQFWGVPGPLDSSALPPSGRFVSFSRSESDRGSSIRIEARNHDLLFHEHLYSLWPLPALSTPPAAPRVNWLALHYNSKYLAEVVFPRLLAKYSTTEDRSEFRFQIGPKAATPSRPELVADVLRFRPDCLLPSGGGATVSVGAVTSKARGVAFARKSFGSQVSVGQRPSLSFLLQTPGQCEAAARGSGLMQIVVFPSKTTLESVFAGFRLHNEFLSAIVLAILIVAVAALVISTERARKLARLETVLAAGLSHELRTPLASLGVAADDLISGHVEDREQARRYGEIISRELRRLGHIVDQALALTGLTQSCGRIFLRSVSVCEIVKKTLDGLAPRLDEAQMKAEMQIAQNVPNIVADPVLVLRSLTNLVENAIKYARSGGWVRLSARPCRRSRRPGVEIVVEDRGPGISEEEAALVFEPFYRGSAARRCRETGSGLGLAIVQSAVRANGGWIKLDRALPQGCKFRLFFPADRPGPPNSGNGGALA